MGLLNRETILQASDLKTEQVAVPEWGGDVLVSTMTGEARDAWEASLVIRKPGKAEANLSNVRARLAAATLVDETGARMFTQDDIEMLGAKSSAALDRVCKVAQRLNGLGDQDLEELKGN